MRKATYTLFVAVLLCLGTAMLAQAQATKFAQAGMGFLKIDPAADVAALGGTHAGVTGRATAMFSNPAAMALLEGGDVTVGNPLVSGGSVSGKVLKQGKTRKVNVVKFRRRQNYLRQGTHRQFFTEVEITDISAAGAKPAAAKSDEKSNGQAATKKTAAKKAVAKKTPVKKTAASEKPASGEASSKKKVSKKTAAKQTATKKDD